MAANRSRSRERDDIYATTNVLIKGEVKGSEVSTVGEDGHLEVTFPVVERLRLLMTTGRIDRTPFAGPPSMRFR